VLRDRPGTSTSSSPAGARARARRGRRPRARRRPRSSTRWTPARRASGGSSGDPCSRGSWSRRRPRAPGKTTRRDRAHGGADRAAGCWSARTRSAPTTSTPATTRWPTGGPAATSTRCWSASSLSPRCCCTAPAAATSRGRGRHGPVRRARLTAPARPPTWPACVDAPVVLVVDASSMSRSVAALVSGFAAYDPAVRLAGVVLNRVGSERHERLLREALDGVARCWASCTATRRSRRRAAPRAGARRRAHPEAVATVRRLGELCARSLDLDALLAVARSAPRSSTSRGSRRSRRRRSGRSSRSPGGPRSPSPTPRPPSCSPPRAPTSRSSTRCATRRCPPGTAGWCSAAGFPEVFAEQLSANRGLREDVARLAGTVRRSPRVRRPAVPVRAARRPADVRRAARRRRP
jgi:hypothetical protein